MKASLKEIVVVGMALTGSVCAHSQTSFGQLVLLDPVVTDLRPQDEIPAQAIQHGEYALTGAAYGNPGGTVLSRTGAGPIAGFLGHVEASIVTPDVLANGVVEGSSMIVEAAPWAGPPTVTWVQSWAQVAATQDDWGSGGWLLAPHTQLVISGRYSFAAQFTQSECTLDCQQVLARAQMDWSGPLGAGSTSATWSTSAAEKGPGWYFSAGDDFLVTATLTNDTDSWQEEGWRAYASLSYSYGAPPPPVPEPGTLALIVAGLAVLTLGTKRIGHRCCGRFGPGVLM